MTLRERGVLGSFVILSLAAATAGAQVPEAPTERVPRPYGGVFGGNPSNSVGLRQSLEAVFSVGGGSEWNDFLESAALTGDIGETIGGRYSGFDGGLTFSQRGRSVDFGASVSSRVRYQEELARFLSLGHTGAVGFSATVRGRTRIQAQQVVTSTPLFSLNPFPELGPGELGQVTAPSTDLALVSRDGLTYTTTAGLARDISGRTAVGLGYVLDRADFSADDIQSLQSQSLTANATYRITPTRDLVTTYVVRDDSYELDAVAMPVRAHQVEINLGQRWIHSRTRDTTLRVSAGTALVQTNNQTFTLPVGGVQFASMVGRSWTLRASYRRGVDAIPGYSNVTSVDAVGADVSGLFTERIEMTLTGGVSRGDVGFGGARGTFETFTGSARIGVAASRVLGLFTELFYYRYDATAGAFLPGVVGQFTRYGVRAGLSLWVPIVRRRSPS